MQPIMQFDENAPLQRDAETGLVLPPWAPPQVRVQMELMPTAQKKQIQQQQMMTVKQVLGLPASSTPTEADYKVWLKKEFENMKMMMAMKGGKGGHGHSHGGGHGHSHGGKPCTGHGHSHGGGKGMKGGYGGGHSHGPQSHGGAGAGGHSHGGVPCQGHSHGGNQGPGMAAMMTADGILRSMQPLDIPSKIDTTIDIDQDSGLVLPKWIPEWEKEQLLSMSVPRRKLIRRHQILSIRASQSALEGTLAEPTAKDLSEPTDAETKQWLLREWTKINLLKVDEPPAASLVGQWVYGRRKDGNVSGYEISETNGVATYREMNARGDVLEGTLVKASEGPAVPEEYKAFKPVWHLKLKDGKGLLWFAVIDGVSIESLYVLDMEKPKGFFTVARRAWVTLAGAPEPLTTLLTEYTIKDEETGLIIPPWAPATAAKHMTSLSAEEKKNIKGMQEASIRKELDLADGAAITEETVRAWMTRGYEQAVERQQQMLSMAEGARKQMLQAKVDKVKELAAEAKKHEQVTVKQGTASKADLPPELIPKPQTAEDAELEAQLAAINQMVMENMKLESEPEKKGPALD